MSAFLSRISDSNNETGRLFLLCGEETLTYLLARTIKARKQRTGRDAHYTKLLHDRVALGSREIDHPDVLPAHLLLSAREIRLDILDICHA